MIPAKSACALRARVTVRLGTDIRVQCDTFPYHALALTFHALDQRRSELVFLSAMYFSIRFGDRHLQTLPPIPRLHLAQSLPGDLTRASVHTAFDFEPNEFFE